MKLPWGIRSFNKRYLNRLTGRIARSSRGPFSIVRHMGRRSGKLYETPIIAIPTSDGFIIALTYGPQVDWFRNVSAAGHCQILWHKHKAEITKIEPLQTQAAMPYFPWLERTVLKLVGIQDFVHMQKEAAA